MKLKNTLIDIQEQPSLIELIRQYVIAIEQDSFPDKVALHAQITRYLNKQLQEME